MENGSPMFIVITGGDKCGKTTQCGLLASRLREFGSKVFETKVPDTTTSVGKSIRKLLKVMNVAPAITEGHHERTILESLFVTDRLHTEKMIERAETEGNIVVCSRWAESASVYSQASGYNEVWLSKLIGEARTPDLLILLDVPAQSYDDRKAKEQGSLEAYDQDYELQRQVRSNLRVYPGVHRVDGSRSPEDVAESVWKVVVLKLLEMATTDVDRDLKTLVRG